MNFDEINNKVNKLIEIVNYDNINKPLNKNSPENSPENSPKIPLNKIPFSEIPAFDERRLKYYYFNVLFSQDLLLD